MNRNDIKLIVGLVLFMLIFFILKISNDSGEKIAKVYYEDELIETFSLSNDGKYTVMGYNGEVVIEVSDNKVRVIEEKSEKNLCSKQGYGDVIICLPNRIIIKVENDKNELDGVVR